MVETHDEAADKSFLSKAVRADPRYLELRTQKMYVVVWETLRRFTLVFSQTRTDIALMIDYQPWASKNLDCHGVYGWVAFRTGFQGP